MSPELFVHTFNCLEEAGQTAAQPDGDIGSMMNVRDEGRTRFPPCICCDFAE